MDSIPEATVRSLQNRIQLLVTEKFSEACAVLSGLGFSQIIAVHSRWALSFVSICKSWVVR